MSKFWPAFASVTALLVACSGATATDVVDQRESTTPTATNDLCLPGDGDGTVHICHSMGGNASLDIWSDFAADFAAPLDKYWDEVGADLESRLASMEFLERWKAKLSLTSLMPNREVR